MKKETCATRLTKALFLNNMKQTDLSRKTQIPKSAISQYISGAFEPKQDRVELIAKALNVSEAWLMGYDVPMERTDNNHIFSSEKQVPPILSKFNQLNNIGKIKADSYIDGLLENPSYTKTIESNLDRTVFGHETYPRAVAAPDVTTHIDNRKKKVRHT